MKRSAVRLVEKEEDFVRLEKQLDEAVVEENGAKRKFSKEDKDGILSELEEIAEIEARKQKVKDIYEKGYNYTKVGMPDGRTIQKLFSTKGNKLVAKVEQEFKQLSKLSGNKKRNIVLINGTICRKYFVDVILH